MEAKVEKLGGSKLKLTISVSAKEMAGYFNQSYQKIVPTIKLDGFRPGNAPRKLIESAAGISRILSEGLDLAVSENYFNALKDNNISPLTSPNIVINSYPNYGSTAEEVKEDFEFEAEVETMPEAKLGDWKKLKKIKKEKPEAAKKEDADKVLSHFQKQSATMNEVDRAAEKGDHVDLSFEGFLKHVRIDQMCSKNHPLILGEGSLIPGFEDEVVGMKKGEKKEFEIKFPADYHSKEYAGKNATFKIELNNLREVKLPELDAAFAEKFGHKNLPDLKKAIEENLNKELEENARHKLEESIVDLVVPLLKVEVPEVLVEREIERLIGQYSAQLAGQGLNFDRYLESVKKTRDDMKKDMHPQAEKNVKVGIMLGKIIEQEGWDQGNQEAGKKAIDYLIKELTE